MKTKKLIACASMAVVLFAGFMLRPMTTSRVVLDKNVEALTQEENPVLTNLPMHIWWVTEYFGGEAIICTGGGDLPCE